MRLLAPAKINLALDVLGRRADGYHQVVMVMQTIALADTVTVAVNEGHGAIRLAGGTEEAPPDADNLVYRAAQLVRETAGLSCGVDIDLEKVIPVAAGLAGGSSDAAATVKALNRLFRLGWSDREMETLLARLGSDIPFLVRGGTALATGRGEIVHRLPPAPAFWVVLVKPPFGASTPKVYKALGAPALPDPLPWPQAMKPATTPPGTAAYRMIEALKTGDYGNVLEALGNDLEQVTLEWHPVLKEIKVQLTRFGCDRALMSGSGPTILGFTASEATARSVAAAMEEQWGPQRYRVLIARTLEREEADEWNVDCCR
ncbi:4-diphosphocytidyl-2c-methyl-d-erythritol kinase [Heliomicrobium modesticaldum Ice1]|uniref:4-diphosphocytidyl-2-C-methyl-D-erythritol kinase n=1 Tax=Heliobacterium modesticaldum (strain ATCC 51547 / Ice1) TaxID=498761 RepID=ISPE_HELMI|nr:4-(cytidine 5'-diphospho)-2-C-methyl-D-erythritol kinase [Heliomicrobium modesticaldum]B0TB90.1 RecName: Full=4-diphosphocytidyl-2-C-methyl-D-erythritol kinase; Short=CMK; AltName: Full=4-(cytidine-5'-diphospho)-2-C-methyl-D-erythritol kinase [Heliomicrobium modesticaldum Ice1]ABZ83817.1 4-diphosphocytidyl-2c-methyl-d-erythritol kinase [Heliomicrobium modesticaldum Ice1]